MMVSLRDDSWVLRLFPELRRAADSAQREQIWRCAVNSGVRRAVAVLCLWPIVPGLAYLCFVVPWIAAVTGTHPSQHPLRFAVYAIIVLVPTELIVVPLTLWLCRGRIRRLLRIELTQQGTAVCIGCGYDLQGLTDPRCPECGIPFNPGLLKTRTDQFLSNAATNSPTDATMNR